MQLTLLGSAVVLLLIWLIVRRRNQSQETPAPTETKAAENTAYHAVSIKFDENACNAAKEMGGRRFLSTAAPRLPLPECNALECRCHFAHHKDRRAGKDRRSPFVAVGHSGRTGSFEKERRERQDRRKDTDLDVF